MLFMRDGRFLTKLDLGWGLIPWLCIIHCHMMCWWPLAWVTLKSIWTHSWRTGLSVIISHDGYMLQGQQGRDGKREVCLSTLFVGISQKWPSWDAGLDGPLARLSRAFLMPLAKTNSKQLSMVFKADKGSLSKHLFQLGLLSCSLHLAPSRVHLLT